jgi:hypothetical protein
MARNTAKECNQQTAGHNAPSAWFSSDDKKYSGHEVRVVYVEENCFDVTINGATRHAYYHDVADLAGKFVAYPRVSVSKDIDGGVILRLSRNHRQSEGWPKSVTVSMSWTPVRD